MYINLPPTALICGISGQDGAYLAQLLLAKGYVVIGTARDAQMSSFANLDRLGIRSQVTVVSMAINDFRSVLQVLSRHAPAEVYNLAGQSSVGLSFEQPVETLESISVGTLNLLEVIRFLNRDIRFYNAGSGECFGDTGAHARQMNTRRSGRAAPTPWPRPPPSGKWPTTAKPMACLPAREFCSTTNRLCVPSASSRRRSCGPLAALPPAAPKRLHLGNLDIQRDWGWAPEYVEAMWKMLQHSQPEDFVIATGKTHSLLDFVETAFATVNLDWRDHVDRDSSLMRPTDLAVSCADPRLAADRFGWQAGTQMQTVVKKMIEAQLPTATVRLNS